MAPAATGTEWVGTAGDCGVTGDDDDGGGGHTRGAGGGGDGEHPNGGAGGGGGDGGCTGMGDGEVDDGADNADVIIDGGRVEGTGRPHAWGGACTETDASQDGAAAAPRTPAPQQAWTEVDDGEETTTADRFVRWARVNKLENETRVPVPKTSPDTFANRCETIETPLTSKQNSVPGGSANSRGARKQLNAESK